MYLTLRQAEALWAAREEGSALALLSTAPHSGSYRRMIKHLRERGLLTDYNIITAFGMGELARYEAKHKLNPRTKRNPGGRWV